MKFYSINVELCHNHEIVISNINKTEKNSLSIMSVYFTLVFVACTPSTSSNPRNLNKLSLLMRFNSSFSDCHVHLNYFLFSCFKLSHIYLISSS